MFKVIAYGKTGFNAVNVPDNETTLNNAASYKKEFPAIDVIQRYFQPKITVKAFEDDVIDIDYIKLVDDRNPAKFAFYSVTGYTMTSGDVAELNVVMDSFLTAGGVGSFEFLDGTTTRHHTATDTFGEFPEDDEMLVPKAVYVGHVGNYMCNTSSDAGNLVLLISQYDLDTTPDMKVYNGVKFKSTGSAEAGYVFSMVDGQEEDNGTIIKRSRETSNRKTTVIAEDPDTPLSWSVDGSTADAKYYNYNSNSYIKQNLRHFIEGGRTDVIQDAYCVPKGHMSQGSEGVDGFMPVLHTGEYKSEYVEFAQTYEGVSCAVDLTQTSSFNFIKNKRTLYGKHLAYTFMSNTSGEKITINPEMLHISPLHNGPDIHSRADVRSGGFPTFYFPTPYDFESSGKRKGIPAASIKGNSWPKADVILSAAAGKIQASEMYDLQQQAANANASIEYYQGLYGTSGKSFISGAKEGIKDLFRGNANQLSNVGYNNMLYGDDLTGFYNDMVSGVAANNMDFAALYTAAAQGNASATTLFNRQAQARQEKAQYLHSIIPQVQVLSSQSSKASIPMYGNGVMIFRNFVSTADIRKFDRILTQFGYKVTEPVKTSFLNNRQKFNYIEAKGVSVRCDNVPKSVRDDLAAMFNVGIRIWHTKPNSADYDIGNPVKGGSN